MIFCHSSFACAGSQERKNRESEVVQIKGGICGHSTKSHEVDGVGRTSCDCCAAVLRVLRESYSKAVNNTVRARTTKNISELIKVTHSFCSHKILLSFVESTIH